MTAAKVMDVVAILPDCDGQAADAVSAYTQVEMEDAQRLLIIPKSDCPDVWIRLPRHGQNHGQASKTQWFFSNEICTDIHLPASCGKDNLRKFCWDLAGKKYRTGNVFVFTDNKDCSCRYTWMMSTWPEGQHVVPMWKKLMELVDIDEPT